MSSRFSIPLNPQVSGVRRAVLLALLAVTVGSVPARAQSTGQVTGTVVDAQTEEPLAGATLVVVGTDHGAVSGTSGEFVISNVPPGTYALRATRLGYAAGEAEVVVRAGESAAVSLAIEAQAVQLQEIVAIGYGTMRRADLTGSVVSVSQDDIRALPTHDVRDALRGRVPGMDVTRSNGSPNSGVNMTLRGHRSLTASNSPLVIIDGLEAGRLQDLNPNDIESIEVLKDAASTAIYGSRGANGVILVTTRTGTAATSVTLSSYVGITEVSQYPRMNTGPEYIEQKREANRTIGLWESPDDDHRIFTPLELQNIENGVWTDFPRLLLDRRGVARDHQLGISAGTDHTRAYLSLGARTEEGILLRDERTRYSLRLNLDHTLSDRWRIGTMSQITYHDFDQRRNPMNLANKIAPLTAAHDADGNLIMWPNDGKDISPLADQEPNAYVDNTVETRIVPSFFAEYTPLDGLTIRSQLAANLVGERRGVYRDPNTIDRHGSASEAQYNVDNARNVSFENVLTYRAGRGQHSLHLTGVGSYQHSQSDLSRTTAQNQLLSSQLFYGLANATEGVSIQSAYEESTLVSAAGRVNYGWADRYLVTLTGRFDGSSRLSPGNQWAFFPSISAAWRVNEESFLQGNTWFDELKLRLSYGVSGNYAVAPYSTQAILARVPYSFGETPAPGLTFGSRLGNEDLKWELSATTNVGLDVGFWNNRVWATVDLYRTNTKDLLMERFLPVSSGVSSIMQNVGRTRNQGIELSLTTDNIQSTNLSWHTNLSFFSNKEEIVDLVGGTDDIGNGWFIGHPTSVFYDWEKIGIWQLDEADAAAAFGQEPGEIKVHDQTGDGVISPDDRIVLGSPRPRWSGGLTNTVMFRSFDLNASIFARIGQMMNYEFAGNWKPDGIENGSRIDYWTPDNPTNAYPRPNARLSNNNYPYFSTLRYADGSFVKLRDVTLGYALPSELTQRLSIGRARLYVTGRDLLTWSRVGAYDPERAGPISSPMTRMIVAGFDIGF